jgi:hypothetical protein
MRLKLIYHIFGIALIFLFLSCDFASSNNETTVYPLRCKEVMEGETYTDEYKCKEGWIPLNKTIYRLFSERQEVVYWIPGISTEPTKYTNCVIADNDNWKCTYSDGSGSIGYMDGEYFEKPEWKGTIHVSKWRYYYWHFYWRFK